MQQATLSALINSLMWPPTRLGMLRSMAYLVTLKKFKVDYRVIPWTTFIDPEVARVGINEQEALEQGIDFEITRFEFKELDRAITEVQPKALLKLLHRKAKIKYSV